MIPVVLGEPLEHGRRLGELLLFGEAHSERVEHVGDLRGLGVVAEKLLPGRDGLVAPLCLPERLAGKVCRLSRLRMRGAPRREVPQRGRRGGEGLLVRLLLRGAEQAASQFQAGERERVGVRLARDHLTKRLLGRAPVVLLELADRQVVAALESEGIGRVGLDECRPLLGGQIPGLAVLKGGGGGVGRAGGVAGLGCPGEVRSSERGGQPRDERKQPVHG